MSVTNEAHKERERETSQAKTGLGRHISQKILTKITLKKNYHKHHVQQGFFKISPPLASSNKKKRKNLVKQHVQKLHSDYG